MTELPAGFIERLVAQQPGLFDGLADALSEAPSVSVRSNRAKGFRYAGEAVPWCREGVYLPERPLFTLDPRLHQGLYYVQDASSMFISLAAKTIAAATGAPLRWLDACAAPGGKTTAVADTLPVGSLVVANELSPQRAAVLRENVIKWGNPSVIVTRGDSRRWSALSERFDVVAADVPCSGEGMMRKDPDAVAQWSPALIRECASRQREIITSLWEAVAPGGWMVYSTCTFNREENDDMIRFIIDNLGGEYVEIEGIDPSWGIIASECGYRFIPGRVRGEGLFMALLRKPGQRRPWAPNVMKADNNPARKWLYDNGNGLTVTTSTDGRINAFPTAHINLLNEITTTKGIDVIHHGTVVARMKGRDMIPDHSLALSTALRREAFPQVELDLNTALAYLRYEAVSMPDGTPKGHVLLTFGDHPLGFVKNLGNRCNSLYPREWRIHMR